VIKKYEEFSERISQGFGLLLLLFINHRVPRGALWCGFKATRLMNFLVRHCLALGIGIFMPIYVSPQRLKFSTRSSTRRFSRNIGFGLRLCLG